MPWRRIDPFFYVALWSSWIGVGYLDFNSPGNSLPGLVTIFYPLFLGVVFLVPLGWYLYERRNPEWKYWHYGAYLAGWVAFAALYFGVASLPYMPLVDMVLSALTMILIPAGIGGGIWAHVRCVERWRGTRG